MDPATQKLPFIPPSLCCFIPSERAKGQTWFERSAPSRCC